MTIPSRFIATLSAALLATTLLGGTAVAQNTPADRDDAALAYAQCMRDNGFTEFPDPSPDGDLRIRVNPESAPRFQAAGEACKDLAPEGFRDDGVTPEQLDALIKLSQCVRENGIPDFPDPKPDGRFDLRSTGIGPGDARMEAAMEACSDLAQQTGRIIVGG